jgi:hypothetical protein
MVELAHELRRAKAGLVADRKLRHDLKILLTFTSIYCEDRHAGESKTRLYLKTHDVDALAGQSIDLCKRCTRLVTHALVKRTNCSMDPKPACKHCPVHCYQPAYRAEMKEVMRYSGRKLLFSGRLDYLFRLLF